MPLYEMFLMNSKTASPSDKALEDDIEALLGQIEKNVSAKDYSPETSECIENAYLRAAYMCLWRDELPEFRNMLEGIANNRVGCKEIESYISNITELAYR